MKIAAIVFIVLYMLVGLRYVFWAKVWLAAEQGVREGAGIDGKCPHCHPTPPIHKWLAIIIGCTGDALIWPLNVIFAQRAEGKTGPVEPPPPKS
jgi:hypothetical protein